MNEDAKKFMGAFPNSIVQTYDEREYDCEHDFFLYTQKQYSKYTDSELKTLNDSFSSVTFTPNSFVGNSRGGLRPTRLNAWFIDIDNLPKEDQMKLLSFSPLDPSIIVESRKSYHFYWLAKDATYEMWPKLQRSLAKAFGSDTSLDDYGQCMRVPGYYNNKEVERFLCKLVKFEPNISYTEKEFADKFPPIEKPEPDTKGAGSHIKSITDDFSSLKFHVNSMEVLHRMSGSRICDGETYTFRPRGSKDKGYHIFVNGKAANAWIDRDGKIGSPESKKGGPSWFQWLQFIWTNKEGSFTAKRQAEAFEWFEKKCADICPDGLTKEYIQANEIQANQILPSKMMEGIEVYKWGVPIMDKLATPLTNGQYVVLAGETNAGKTPFALQILKENSRLHRCLFISLEMDEKAVIGRYSMRRAGITNSMIRDEKGFDWKTADPFAKEFPDNFKFLRFDSNDKEGIIEAIRKGDYKIACIDNLGYVGSEEREENDRMKAISRSLQKLVKDTGITVIALHHFRKKAGEKAGQIRSLDSLIGTAKISHDASMVLQVMRNMEENATPEDKLKFTVAIQKDRMFGDTNVFFMEYKNGLFVDKAEEFYDIKI